MHQYQRSRFPSTIHETVLRLTEKGSERVAQGSMGYHADLMLVMCRPTLWERLRALLRGHWIRTMSCDQAQIHAAVACEACSNSLAYEHGLSWGYRRGSAGWSDANTRCELCLPKVEA
jgi:hypothetical protein